MKHLVNASLNGLCSLCREALPFWKQHKLLWHLLSVCQPSAPTGALLSLCLQPCWTLMPSCWYFLMHLRLHPLSTIGLLIALSEGFCHSALTMGGSCSNLLFVDFTVEEQETRWHFVSRTENLKTKILCVIWPGAVMGDCSSGLLSLAVQSCWGYSFSLSLGCFPPPAALTYSCFSREEPEGH